MDGFSVSINRMAAHIYSGFGHLAESKMKLAGSSEAKALVGKAVSELGMAREFVDKAFQQINDAIHYLYEHWDEDFEKRLRETGFKGSLFVLRDFRMHLESIKDGLASQITVLDAFVKNPKAPGTARIPFDPDDGAISRSLCRACIRFLDFEDLMAQTQMVRFSAQAFNGVCTEEH
jgi:hypothetical protein